MNDVTKRKKALAARERRAKKREALRNAPASAAAAERKKARDRMRAYRAANANKVRAAQRDYDSKRYAEKSDALRARARERYLEKAKQERERASVWRAENLEKSRELVRNSKRKWRAANPELSRALGQQRRASTKTSTAAAPTAQQIKALLTLPCCYCGDTAEHIDHYIPLARGGTHTLENLRPACAPCNLSKGAKLPGSEWRGRLTARAP